MTDVETLERLEKSLEKLGAQIAPSGYKMFWGVGYVGWHKEPPSLQYSIYLNVDKICRSLDNCTSTGSCGSKSSW